jgi:hypothetical protein
MNRSDLQQLAEARVRESQALLAAGETAGAYYVGGYAAECALKACIAKQTRQYDFPDRRLVNASHTHNLSELLGLAGLRQALGAAAAGVQANWAIAKDWSEQSRYEMRTSQEAQDLFDALTDPSDGVLPWLRQHW